MGPRLGPRHGPHASAIHGEAQKTLSFQRKGESLVTKTAKFSVLAGGLGFEPRQPESESGVLPLDDPPTRASALGKLELADIHHSCKPHSIKCAPIASVDISQARGVQY
jgi:hypothetical protein